MKINHARLLSDPHQVLEDVLDGYYTTATEQRDYGVIITPDGQLDL